MTLRFAYNTNGAANHRLDDALALIAATGKLWADGLAVLSPSLAPFTIGTWITALNQRFFGPAWMGRTVMVSWEPMFIAAGAITGLFTVLVEGDGKMLVEQ